MMSRLVSIVAVAAIMIGICAELRPAAAQLADVEAIRKRYFELYDAHDYAAALVEAQRLETLVKARLGTNHPIYADVLNNLAVVHRDQGKYGEAEQLFRRALAIVETVG